MGRSHSPAPSTTSASDNDDDVVKSIFFAGSDPLIVAPAQWTKHRTHPTGSQPASDSPVSTLPPEVLIHVLKHLHSLRDLYCSLRVSRTWCECSVELLWHKPSFSRVSTLVKMMQVLNRGDQTFTYARFIRRLNFLSLGTDLTDPLFTRLTQCDRLERLTLVNCDALTDDGLSRVLLHCSNLVAIDLTGVSRTSDRAIVGLALSAKRLQGINLGGCKLVSDEGVCTLANSCPLLRRVKLSGLELVNDQAVSALAKSCPLLLEIDLNNCKLISDLSIRDIWMYSTHMREMRLSGCADLTDAAFPAPLRPEVQTPSPAGPNPFPSTNGPSIERVPPLVLSRSFEHLRMLDLTGCALLTDDAVEGIISHAPKIRTLWLSKCIRLTDKSVESICKLGKHIHYLHLGHAANITDRSVRTLARCCTRLRYVDFANCTNLTDMSVFELSSLPKLRRIGLVRVNNITDEAIYSLADRHSTLERIHLSYCDQISVMAIHFLLQRLHKLTHLSLTGVTAFRKPELQHFCRSPPSDFNMSQRAAFCVYSGKGVSELRSFLAQLFEQITEINEINAADDTEYEDGYDAYQEDTPEDDMEVENDGDEDEGFGANQQHRSHQNGVPNEAFLASRLSIPQPNLAMYRGNRPPNVPAHLSYPQPSAHPRERATRTLSYPAAAAPERPTEAPSMVNLNAAASRLNSQMVAGPSTVTATAPAPRARGFGQQLIVETSRSPPPSEVASSRSTGTNHSNGAGFFRAYQEGPGPSSSRSNGALTPDLNFAEIGHGRGAENGNSAPMGAQLLTPRRNGHEASRNGPSPHGIFQAMHSSGSNVDVPSLNGTSRPQILADSSNSCHTGQARPPVVWPHIEHDQSPSSSPTRRDLYDTAQFGLGVSTEFQDASGRGRRVKRSFRSTLSAAEQYASTFLFGRGSNGHEGGSGLGGGADTFSKVR